MPIANQHHRAPPRPTAPATPLHLCALPLNTSAVALLDQRDTEPPPSRRLNPTPPDFGIIHSVVRLLRQRHHRSFSEAPWNLA
ncbi:hypothetical protein U1Q18_030939 [Sarracenia purpurea var. burkii]